MLKILAGNYPPPSSVVSGLSEAVDRIVMKALEPDVVLRYQTALEMALEIETHLAPASQRVVGEWVRDLAGPTLESRAELLHQIEISRIHSVPPMPEPIGRARPRERAATYDDDRATVPGVDPVSFVATFGAQHAPPARRPRRWIGAAIAGSVLVVAGAAMLVRHRAPPPPTPVQPALAAAATNAAMAAPEPTATPAANSTPTPTSTPIADATPTAARPRPTRPAPSPRRPSPRPAGNARTFLPDDL
jgi:hypothetical protein